MELDEIIEKAGGVTQLARIAEVDHSTISAGWRRRGKVSIAAAMRISERLGIPRHEIRPDIWPAQPEMAGDAN